MCKRERSVAPNPRGSGGRVVRLARRRRGMREVNQDQIWSQVQEELRFQLAKRTYDMWLKNTSVVSAEGNTFRIGVPSQLAKDWLESPLSRVVQETLQAVTRSRGHNHLRDAPR